MKKFTIALLLVICLSSTIAPASVHAASRAELLQQIELLTRLISLLQKQLAFKTQQVDVLLGDSITYTRMSGYLDERINRTGITFNYSTSPQCDSTTTSDAFRVEFGDGQSAAADCKGVVEHLYDKDGVYTATYYRNDDAIAKVEVEIRN